MALHALGYEVVIDNSCDDWDYGDAARYLLDRFHQLRREHPKLCLLSGGEVTVRLGHEHGAGGRNQQFALACALARRLDFAADGRAQRRQRRH
jgi:glycerate 2-kinase